jgi:hypothetical protein
MFAICACGAVHWMSDLLYKYGCECPECDFEHPAYETLEVNYG